MAKKILIKVAPHYHQTGEAIKNYLKTINVSVDITDKEFCPNYHLYDKIIVLEETHCVDITLFKNLSKDRKLDTFYWGGFTIDKVIQLFGKHKDIHIYNDIRWPIPFSRNFIGIASIEDLQDLANTYKQFEWIDGDMEWVYQTLVYCGCEPVTKKNIPVITSKELVEKLGINNE